MRQLENNLAQLRAANFQFDEWLHLVGEEQIYEAGFNTNFPLHPAHYWTHIAGNTFVNFIGRVENFEADFARFAERVGIDPAINVNLNVDDLTGSSDRNPFSYRYIDRMNVASIDKINRLFAEDFELFGYEKLKSGSPSF
jgi:hypothetical protein